MRPILLVFLVFAAGILLGHEYWPNSHPDPAWHFRFHRGKMPPTATEEAATNKPPVIHGRILRPPQNGS
jgi:hypothetical protein